MKNNWLKFSKKLGNEKEQLGFEDGLEPVGKVGHDAVHAGSNQAAHVFGLVYRPGGHVQIGAVRFVHKFPSHDGESRAQLPGAHFEGLFRGFLILCVEQQAGHH